MKGGSKWSAHQPKKKTVGLTNNIANWNRWTLFYPKLNLVASNWFCALGPFNNNVRLIKSSLLYNVPLILCKWSVLWINFERTGITFISTNGIVHSQYGLFKASPLHTNNNMPSKLWQTRLNYFHLNPYATKSIADSNARSNCDVREASRMPEVRSL